MADRIHDYTYYNGHAWGIVFCEARRDDSPRERLHFGSKTIVVARTALLNKAARASENVLKPKRDGS